MLNSKSLSTISLVILIFGVIIGIITFILSSFAVGIYLCGASIGAYLILQIFATIIAHLEKMRNFNKLALAELKKLNASHGKDAVEEKISTEI